MSDTTGLKAEYLAAKAAYAAALKRVTAAKAALDVIGESYIAERKRARRREQLEMSAKALEAWVGGATQKEACQAIGMSPNGATFQNLRNAFFRTLPVEDRSDKWDRATAAKWVARYRESIAP